MATHAATFVMTHTDVSLPLRRDCHVSRKRTGAPVRPESLQPVCYYDQAAYQAHRNDALLDYIGHTSELSYFLVNFSGGALRTKMGVRDMILSHKRSKTQLFFHFHYVKKCLTSLTTSLNVKRELCHFVIINLCNSRPRVRWRSGGGEVEGREHYGFSVPRVISVRRRKEGEEEG